jgi:hypothetical protein
MAKFDFRRQLKGMDLEGLKKLESIHLDYMLGFMGYDDKESSKHSRYVGYIKDAQKRLQDKNQPVNIAETVSEGSRHF